MARRLRKTMPEERLSPSEWEIMQICWRLGRCTVREVLCEDLKVHKRDYRTILTFMTRMAKKGWLATQKRANTNYYRPTADSNAALIAETERFLESVVGTDPEKRRLVRDVVRRGLVPKGSSS